MLQFPEKLSFIDRGKIRKIRGNASGIFLSGVFWF